MVYLDLTWHQFCICSLLSDHKIER